MSSSIPKRDFWVLAGSLWVVGVLGIILSYNALNNAKKLKEIPETQDTKTEFPRFMLIVFIAILIGTWVYAAVYIKKNWMVWFDYFLQSNFF